MYLLLSPVVLLVSALLSYGLLMLWYSPSVFGPNTFFTKREDGKAITMQFVAFSFILFLIFTIAFSVLISATIILRVSILGVLASTVAYYLFSMLWYSPGVFGKYLQIEKKTPRSMPVQLIGSFLLSLLFCWGFSVFLSWMRPSSYLASTFIAIISWLAFSVSKHLRTSLWDCDNKVNSWIHIGADLAKFIIVSIILTSMGKPPRTGV